MKQTNQGCCIVIELSSDNGGATANKATLILVNLKANGNVSEPDGSRET